MSSTSFTPGGDNLREEGLAQPVASTRTTNNNLSTSAGSLQGLKNALTSIVSNTDNEPHPILSTFTSKFIFWYIFIVCFGGVLLLLVTPREVPAHYAISRYALVMFILFVTGFIVSNYYLNPKNITYDKFIFSLKEAYEQNKFFFMNAYLVIFFIIFTIFTLSILYHQETSTTDQTNVIVKKFDYLIIPSLFIVGMSLAILAFRKEKINNVVYVQNYYGFLYITFLVFLCALYFYDKSKNSYLSVMLGSLFKINLVILILIAIYLILLYFIIQYGKLNKGATYNTFNKPSPFFRYAGPLFAIFIFVSAIALYVKNNEYLAYEKLKKDLVSGENRLNKEILVGMFLVLGIVVFMAQAYLITYNEKLENPTGLAAKTSNILESQSVFFLKGIFAFTVFILSIIWVIKSIHEIQTKKLGIFQFLVNIGILFFIFMLFVRYIIFDEQTQETKLYRFVYALVMVIPCTIRDIARYFWRQYNSQFIGFLLIMIIIFICAVKFQSLKQFLFNQNGTLYIESPIPLDKVNTISTQSFITTPFPYNYAISMWVWIDSFNKTNSSLDCLSIVNYYNYPNMCFNPLEDKLLFLFGNSEKTQIKIPLSRQKWNHIVINSDSINVDIFLNGKLSKTSHLPPYTAIIESNFTSGQENGVSGKICNMNYYTSILSISQIQFLYGIVSTLNPPVILNTGTTLKNMF